MPPAEVIAAHWQAGLVLDRFEMLEGVAPSHAYQMNRAGLLTYHDLAAQNPAVLCTLIADPEVDEAQCAHWVQQAKQKIKTGRQ